MLKWPVLGDYFISETGLGATTFVPLGSLGHLRSGQQDLERDRQPGHAPGAVLGRQKGRGVAIPGNLSKSIRGNKKEVHWRKGGVDGSTEHPIVALQCVSERQRGNKQKHHAG